MMTKFDHGRIAARTLGVLFVVVGLVSLIDFAIHHQRTKNALNEMGRTNYGAVEENKDQGAFSTFFHNTYYVVTPIVSPIGSVGFLLVGLGFFGFSGILGRLIGGTSSEPTQSEQAGAGQPATRPVVEPEGGVKPQPEAEGRDR